MGRKQRKKMGKREKKKYLCQKAAVMRKHKKIKQYKRLAVPFMK